MTADQFNAAIARLGLSQRAAARYLGVDERTARRYALDEIRIPEPVAKLLRLTIALELVPEHADQLLAGKADLETLSLSFPATTRKVRKR